MADEPRSVRSDAGPGYRPLRRSSGARARARDPAPRASEPALLAARADGDRWLTSPGPSDRTLDLDIVRFGDRAVREPALVIPHPELPNRPFWQRELTEIDG